VKKEFSFSLFDLDWEVFGVNIEGAVNRVPVIEKTGIKSTVCGPGMSVVSFARMYCNHVCLFACLSVCSFVVRYTCCEFSASKQFDVHEI